MVLGIENVLTASSPDEFGLIPSLFIIWPNTLRSL